MIPAPPAASRRRGLTFVPGDEIGEVWEVLRPLGRGGMGSVYACFNKYAPTIRAAVKLLSRTHARDPRARRRFLAEAEVLSGLDHPNIVRVRNVDLEARPPYLEMELVDGRPLGDRIRAGRPMSVGRALHVAGQLFDALAYMHRLSAHHRDIKPDNVLIRRDDSITLVDFGLASREGHQDAPGRIHFGTPGYAPPQWIGSTPLDPVHWDLYAAGQLLFELLAGRLAFPPPDLPDPVARMRAVMEAKAAVPFLDPGPSVPLEVRAIVRALTARETAVRIVEAPDAVRRLKLVEATLTARV